MAAGARSCMQTAVRQCIGGEQTFELSPLQISMWRGRSGPEQALSEALVVNRAHRPWWLPCPATVS